MDHRESFAQWLSAQRHARALTQASLAARLGCSVQTLSRLEKGRTRPSAALAQRLAAAFDIAPGAETTFLAWAQTPAPRGPTRPTPTAPPATRPTGTVTFLFTDVEGSTQLWEHHGAWMEQAHPRHERILRETIQAQGGWAYKQVGDAFQAAFPTAPAALAAAVAAQRALAAEPWGDPGPLRVRMGLHTGQTEEREDDYVGPLLNRAARLLSAGHGGQILLTSTTAGLVHEALPAGVSLRDLGERRLKDLITPERVFQIDIAGLQTDFPPLITAERRPNNLPVPPTPLIDRQVEIAEVRGLLEGGTARLVTLTGTGGTGKTRLALEVAGRLQDAYADGVFLVDLAPVTEPELVGATIAATLGVRETGGQPLTSALQDYLRARTLLLVLDNFERALGAALLVGVLLAAAPGLRVLVTSRAPLHLLGEQTYAVPPLALVEPDGGLNAPAVALFVARARDVRPDFGLTAATGPAVAAICRRLDGLPLAIELAAARTRILPPAAVLDRLERGASLLAGGSVDMPPRHRALHDTIAWSYDLLAPAQQQLFQRLAVFAGGCALPAVEAICAADGGDVSAVLDDLSVLVEQSLLRTAAADAAEARFWMLETIREFAADALRASGRAPALQRWHFDYFLDLCEAAAPMLRGPRAPDRLAALAQEQANWRAALAWAAAHAPEAGLRLAVALGEYWRVRGPWSEGQSWLQRLLAATPDAPGILRGRALVGIGDLALRQSDLAAARRAFEQALDHCRAAGDAAGSAAAMGGLGTIAGIEGADARKWHEAGLALAQEAGDVAGQTAALAQMGGQAWLSGDVGAARADWQEGLALAGAAGDQMGVARALMNQAMLAYEARDYAKARALTESGRALYKLLGNRVGEANTRINLGLFALADGDDAAAEAEFRAALALARDLGSPALVALCLYNMGDLQRAREDYTGAVDWYTESLRDAQAAGLQDRVATALHRLAFVALAQGEIRGAVTWGHAALEIRSQMGWGLVLAQTLAVLGGAAAALGDDVRAARIFGAVATLREPGMTIEPLDLAAYERHCATVRARLDPAMWDAAWAAGTGLRPEAMIALGQEVGRGDTPAPG